ncbi:MAG: DUF1796 family putative cysteine peptidase [Candidatus Gastranaerophilaceae bacterium]
MTNYQIISLGKDCIPRTFLTNAGIFPSKAQGRKSMVFDLGYHNPSSIIEYLNNDFKTYFDNFDFKYDENLSNKCWINENKNFFPHDNDCKTLNEFKQKYNTRINEFNNAINSDKLTFFVYMCDSTTEELSNIYTALEKKRGEKPFKLIVWNCLNTLEEIPNNEDILVYTENFPWTEDYFDWFKPEYQTAETEKFIQNVVNFTKNVIEKYADIKFPQPQAPKLTDIWKSKIINFAKYAFSVTNDLDKNAKILAIFNLKIKIKTLHKENPIIVKLDGRMANQMFQWAFARSIAIKTGCNIFFDDSKETPKLNHFRASREMVTVDKPLLNKILRKIIPFRNFRNEVTQLKFKNYKHYVEEMFCKFQPEMLEISAPAHISGFFQSEKYFKNIRRTLIRDFKLIEKLNNENQKILDKIKSTESISVHFRRGDYLKSRVANVFGACSESYYQAGIDEIASRIDKKPTIFVFSDDINWVKENVKFKYDTVYVDANSGKQGYFDLELMKNCKHNIIANSSFSWWGAWLNENPNKVVVAPKIWMKTLDNDYDIIPTDWIRL